MAVLLAKVKCESNPVNQPWFLVMHELTEWRIYYQKIQIF